MKEQFRYLEHLSRSELDQNIEGFAPGEVCGGGGDGECGVLCDAVDVERAGAAVDFVDRGRPGGDDCGDVCVLCAVREDAAGFHRDEAAVRGVRVHFDGGVYHGWVFAVATRSNLWVQMAMGLTILLLVRYTLRKGFCMICVGFAGRRRAGDGAADAGAGSQTAASA